MFKNVINYYLKRIYFGNGFIKIVIFYNLF